MGMLFQEHVVAPVMYLIVCKLSQQDLLCNLKGYFKCAIKAKKSASILSLQWLWLLFLLK